MVEQIAVTCRNLTKDYGDHNGLFGVDLEITNGEIFGLIGPNGAGKSTFIKLLMDLIRPTLGSAKIFGLDSRVNSLALKRVIGYQPGELMQFPSVTSRYILNLLMNLRGATDFTYIDELAKRLDLDLSRKFQELSHGNKQKVALVQALMHRPKLLILDEPTLGLDPIIQREFKVLMQDFVAAGNTVILSSHVLSEVESICTRIGLINNGRVIKVGKLDELRAAHKHKVTATFADGMPEVGTLRIPGVSQIHKNTKSLDFEVEGSLKSLLDYLAKQDVAELSSRELSLEEVFFHEIQS